MDSSRRESFTPLLNIFERAHRSKIIDSEVLHVFVLPNFFSTEKNAIEKFSKLVPMSWCEDTYHNTFKIIENKQNEVELTQMTFKSPSKSTVDETVRVINQTWEGFCAENIHDKVELEKFLKMITTVVLKIMQEELGLDLNLFFSVDKDEIFITIKCSESNLMVQASLMDYHLQLNDASYEQAMTERKTEVGEFEYLKVAPYGEFELELIKNEEKKNVYKKYNENSKWVKDPEAGEKLSYFTYKDKVRVLLAMINSEIDMGVLLESGIILCNFSMPDENLHELRENWGSFSKFYKKQDLDLVRDYFGERIAMYFMLLKYYIYWLIFPSILGVVVFAIQNMYEEVAYVPGKMFVPDMFLFAFSVILAIGSTVLHQIIIRKQAEYSWVWGTTDMHEIEMQRPRFKGEYGKDPISGQKKKLEKKSAVKYLKRAVGITISFHFVLCTIFIIATLLFYKSTIDKFAEEYGLKMCAILNAFQIKIMNFLYRRIAKKLNDWENYEYDSESHDNLSLKLYLFQFINSYSSLFYIAFFKAQVEGECTAGCKYTIEGCRYSCMYELKIQLGTIFLINMIMNLFELGLPYIKSKISKYVEQRRLRKMQLETGNKIPHRSEYEKERLLEEYEAPLDDYMEIIIDYGYVTMFSSAFPPVALFSLLVNIFEIRVDAFKLCYLTRRPYPAPANSLGEWEKIIFFISILGTLTNTGIIVFTSDIFHLNTYKEKMLYFLIIEHALIIIKIIVARIIPDIPSVVKDGLIWSNRVARERIYNKVSDVDEQRQRFNLKFCREREQMVVLDPDEIVLNKPPSK